MSKAKDARIASLQTALELAGHRLHALIPMAPTDWQKETIEGWADQAIDKALATEARRAATGNTDAVHEGAGLKGNAQTHPSTPDNKDKQDG